MPRPIGNLPIVTSSQPLSDIPANSPFEGKSLLAKVVITVAKVATCIFGLVLLATFLLPLLLLEIGVRGYLAVTCTSTHKPRILVLAAKEDPLHQKTISFALNIAKRRLHREYEIDLHVVANIEDINQTLTQEGPKLAAVWIVAHGNPTEMHLHPQKNPTNNQWEGILWTHNAHQLHFSPLPSQTPIILDACQTGSNEPSLSIAKAIAHVAQDHPVFAPTQNISEFNLVLRSIKGAPLRVEWRRPRFAETDHPLDLATASVWSILLSILPISLFIHEKITKKISNEFNPNRIN